MDEKDKNKVIPYSFLTKIHNTLSECESKMEEVNIIFFPEDRKNDINRLFEEICHEKVDTWSEMQLFGIKVISYNILNGTDVVIFAQHDYNKLDHNIVIKQVIKIE
jgi:hypothetical protein